MKRASYMIPGKEDSLRIPAVCIIAFFVFAALYFVRDIDDNSLTSWRLVFEHVSSVRLFVLVLAGIVVSFFLSRIEIPGPGVLFIMALLVCPLFWAEPEPVVDSSRYFTQAKHLGEYGISYFLRQWGSGIQSWTDLPLIPFLYGLSFRFLGETRIFVQAMTSLMFAMTVALTAMLGRDLFDASGEEAIGHGGGVFLLAMPYLYVQVPLMLVDLPSMFFLTLSIFAFNRFLKRGGGVLMALIASASIFLAFTSKYSLWPMLSVHGFVLLLGVRKAPGAALKRALMVFLVAGGMTGLFLFAYREVIAEQLGLLMTYQRPGLRWWGESFVSTFLFQLHPFVISGALFSIYIAARKKDARFLVLLWPIVLMVVLRVERARYLLPVFPILALMASYGINGIFSAGTRRAVIYCAATVSFLLAAFAYLPFLEKNSLVNLRDAGEYLGTLEGGSVRVLVPPQGSSVNPAVSVAMLDIYSAKKIEYCYDLEPRMSRSEIANSSFRFTWEYRNPGYYEGSLSGGEASRRDSCSMPRDESIPYVVIYSGSGDAIASMMAGRRLMKRFDLQTGAYTFRTFVDVYQ